MSRWVALLLVGCTLECDSNPVNFKVVPQSDFPRVAYSEPIWSPDGTRLAFNHVPLDSIYVDNNGRHQYVFLDSLEGLWMVDSSGAGLRRVFGPAMLDPAWSPDGAWIAFFSTGKDIWKIRTTAAGVDSASLQQLTFQGIYSDPAWNPSSSWLLFSRPSGVTAGIYRLPAGGGGPEMIGSVGWMFPNWSPDSLGILFVGSVAGTQGIGVANAAGDSARVLRSSLLVPEYPKWSPDGSRIAFAARDPSSQFTRLWVMDADGGNLRTATPDAIANGFSWSPDGRQIAYVRFNLNDFSYQNGAVWTVDVGTGVLRQRTFNGPGQP